jgi:hypothetical protein
MFALKKLKHVNLLVKGQTERHFEHTIVSHLQSSPRLRKNIITQIGMEEVQKITKANLFGFSHWPDASIGNDGTAVEIKPVNGGPSIRDILGQGIAYRMHYRFVILVLVDQTEDRKIVELCKDKNSQEFCLLSGLADAMNIFTVVGPAGLSKNLMFVGDECQNARLHVAATTPKAILGTPKAMT